MVWRSRDSVPLRRLVDLWMVGKSTVRMVMLVRLIEEPVYMRRGNVEYVREMEKRVESRKFLR